MDEDETNDAVQDTTQSRAQTLFFGGERGTRLYGTLDSTY